MMDDVDEAIADLQAAIAKLERDMLAEFDVIGELLDELEQSIIAAMGKPDT